MKVLIACEYSGTVRDAFLAKGHEAVSCDILPTESHGPHYKGCVLDILHRGWDMMIAFPPCTHLAVSGSRHFEVKRKDGRQDEAINFFTTLARANISRIAIENPVGIMSSVFRPPDQIIQPYDFGHAESKKTCFWLKNIPLLRATKCLPLPECGYWDNQMPDGQNKVDHNGIRIAWNDPIIAKLRSKTYSGIAEAMACQWGDLDNLTRYDKVNAVQAALF